MALADNMNRSLRYKILFIVYVVVLLGIAGLCILYFKLSTGGILLLALLFLIPGRIAGFFWRDFYRGRKLASMGAWEDAIGYFERFLADVKSRPWLKHMIWFAWGTYTRDIEVMTQNNLGAMQLNLGRLDEAEPHFRAAGELDPEAPLPRYNLAMLEQMRGNTEQAKSLLNEVQRLGYSNTGYDKLIQAAGEALAKIEGRGIK